MPRPENWRLDAGVGARERRGTVAVAASPSGRLRLTGAAWQETLLDAVWVPMSPIEATAELRTRCNDIARSITAMHPLVPRLGDPPAQGEILRALFELTKQVEVVKKHLLRVEKRDDSALL
jgi:hypothetical protein